MKRLKDQLGNTIGFLVIAAIVAGVVFVLAIFGGALMKLFGFTYRSVGSIVLFFVAVGVLAFPVELVVKAVPRVLFFRFGKIDAVEAKIMFVVLDTLVSVVMLSTVDHFMESVSAAPMALFVISLIMALLCMDDVTQSRENKS